MAVQHTLGVASATIVTRGSARATGPSDRQRAHLNPASLTCWAAALFAVVVVPRWVFGVNTDVPIPLVFGVFGFIAGVTFSGLLVLTEGRRRFDQMSLPRFAGWSAVGGLLLSAIKANASSLGWGDVLAIAPTFGVSCAACASGSLVVARRAVGRELRDIRGDTAEAELTDHEQRRLL